MLNKKHHTIIIIIFIIGGITLAFSPQIKSLLTSSINFSLSISAAPQQNQNNNQAGQAVQHGSSTNNAKIISLITFSGNGCPNGTVTLKTNNQNPKTKTTKSDGDFTISRKLKPATYDFEITCKNKNKKITKTILYEKVKLKKDETETLSNINLEEKTSLLKKPTIAIKSRKPRLFKATLKNF